MIGVFIGGIQCCVWLIFSYSGWNNLSNILISIVTGIVLTGGLHLDGLIDMADGLAARPSKCLEAMKDSRIGAIGVISVILILFSQLALLLQLGQNVLIAFPVASFWGRFSQLIAIDKYKYISKGKSSFHHEYWKGLRKEIIPSAVILSVAIFTIIISSRNLILILSILLGLIPSILIPFIINRKLGGHNGDTYGASLVLVETISFLLIAFFLIPNK